MVVLDVMLSKALKVGLIIRHQISQIWKSGAWQMTKHGNYGIWLLKAVRFRARLGHARQERKKPHQPWTSSVSGRDRKATPSSRHRGPSTSFRQLLQDGESSAPPSSILLDRPLKDLFTRPIQPPMRNNEAGFNRISKMLYHQPGLQP